jgi:ABC-type nitrate/sulfonate/bicarbonate transport system substrate-binding protein
MLRPVRVRRSLAGALAVALSAGACGGAGTDRPNAPATLTLDFAPNAVHAGIYSAVERGFDDAEGVALRVRAPSSSTDSVKLLVSGRTDFAVLDIHDLAIARAQGRDLVGFLAIVQRPLAALLAAPGTRSPKDLEGRRVGVSGLPSDEAVLKSIVSGAGGDPGRVRRVTIGFNAVTSLLSRRVDAATAFWNAEGVALRRRRPGIREFRVDDFGAPAYPELVVCATRRTIEERPSLVRATARALARGYEVTLSDPESSAADLIGATRGLERADVLAQLNALDAAFVGPADAFGELDAGRLRAWARWEARFRIVREAPNVARAFDLRFAPR